MSDIGYTWTIIIPGGEPEGLRIFEKSDWSGKAIVFPRPKFDEAMKRVELDRPGVYVLWGPGDESRQNSIYIGQSDTVKQRLVLHQRKKNFWTHAVMFVDSAQKLNAANVKYIEAALHKLAREAGQSNLKNEQTPGIPNLSEAETTLADGYLSSIRLCLRVIGITWFEHIDAQSDRGARLTLKGKDIVARGIDGAKGFLVLNGSQASPTNATSIPGNIRELRARLVSDRVLVSDGDYLRFTQDYLFNSPSTAAGALLGRSANGRIEWKDESGRTLKEIQEAASTAQ